MRDLFIAFLLVLCAVLWWGCSDPVRVASATIDRTTRATMTAEASYKRLTRGRLLQIATEEKTAREKRLADVHCDPKVAPASQPAGVCQTVVAEAKMLYDSRTGKLIAAVTKLDASTGLIYAALLVAVDALELLRVGVGGIPALQALVSKAAAMVADFALVYATFQKEVGRF